MNPWFRLLLGVLAGLSFGLALCGLARAGTIAEYEAASRLIWTHDPPGDFSYQWFHGETDVEAACGYSDTPDIRVVACAHLPYHEQECVSIVTGDGPYRYEWECHDVGDWQPQVMYIDYDHWLSLPRELRCELHAHEWGHWLGWLHEDELFIRMVYHRAVRVCRAIFGPRRFTPQPDPYPEESNASRKARRCHQADRPPRCRKARGRARQVEVDRRQGRPRRQDR